MTIILDDRELDSGNEVTPESLLEAKERHEAVRKALGQLDLKYRKVVEECVMGDMTTIAFARKYGIGKRTAYDRMDKGVAQLRVLLQSSIRGSE